MIRYLKGLTLGHIVDIIRLRFSLKEDKADDATIDRILRAGIEMKGTNLWVLIFAIFVASIGLNVNSIAVIIGAMLISPLMGPIIGLGYGVGILDFQLMRSALKNLGIASLIALITSSIYFLFSPLTSVTSELLARTHPSIWDVLVALFGGFAGVVGVTRKEKSNVIPGVAIATALMPPLCTAGFGLANGNWLFFFGAFYLFTINCVFIAFSSAVVTRAFHVQRKKQVDEQHAKRVGLYILTAVVLTILPSIYLAYLLVQEEVFKARTNTFVRQEFKFKQSHVVETQVDPKNMAIEVTLIGEYIPKDKLAVISEHLANAGLTGATLSVHQAGDRQLDVATLKTDLMSALYTQSQVSLETKDKRIQELQTAFDAEKNAQSELRKIPEELLVLFPDIRKVWLSTAQEWEQDKGMQSYPTILLNVIAAKKLAHQDRQKIEKWLAMRIKSDHVKLIFEAEFSK